MKNKTYDQAERAAQKAASRKRDEDDLASGRISPEEMQYINGGFGMFRNSRLIRRKPKP